jgi:hypothetical protein
MEGGSLLPGRHGLLAGLCIALLQFAAPGCSNGGGNNNNSNDNSSVNNNSNSNDNGGGGSIDSLRVVLTRVTPSETGDIRVGDDVIAVGTGNESGVQYIIPSRGDLDPISLSNFETFQASGFAVTQKWIIVRNFDGDVSVFDSDAESLSTFAEAELALAAGAAAPNFPEFFTDGALAVTFADPTKVTDGQPVKLIDLATSPPTVLSFPDPPVTPVANRTSEIWQAAVDADAERFVVQVTDFIIVYNANDPNAEPQVWDLTAIGGVTVQQEIRLDGDWLIYQAHEQSGNGRWLTRLLNITNGVSLLISENPSRPRPLALQGSSFGYFAHVSDDDVSTNDTARSVFGSIQGDAANVTQLNDARTPLGSDPDDGILAYGCSVAITPDARFRFVAGCGTVAIAEYLYASNGGAFRVIPDQADLDPAGLGTPASNVVASDTLVAFRTSAQMAYIAIPQ